MLRKTVGSLFEFLGKPYDRNDLNIWIATHDKIYKILKMIPFQNTEEIIVFYFGIKFIHLNLDNN